MVASSYYENLEREREEREEAERLARERNRTAGNWLKGILGLATFNEGVWRGATSGSTDKFLQMSADADPVEIALGVATYVAFSYAGGLGTRLGAKNPKGGKLLTYNKVVENAKSKGYTIDPKLKPKVEAEIRRVNNQTDIEQLKGLNKIRTDTLESIGKLLSSAKTAGERAELQKSYNETLIKLQEGGLDVQVAELNKANPAKQYKRDGLSIKEDLEANVEYLNKLDPYKQYSVKNNKIVEDLQKTVESLNKLDPDIQFKVENDAIVRIRKQADPEVIKRNEAITEENLRIAAESIRKMKEAEEKAKAEDKAIDEDPDFDEKGTPDGDEVIETREKLTDEDKPDFSDKADGKESEPLLDKEKPLDEIIDESIERNRQEKEGSDTIKKVSGAGAGAIITTEVVEKLTRTGDDETRRRRNFELDDETGFTEEPVKEGEEGTQPTDEPTSEPSTEATITYVGSYKEKRTQNTENIDELFSITIQACTDVYDNKIGEEKRYNYFGNFDVPFLFFRYQRILYIAFRGTDSISNIITDLSTAEINLLKTRSTSNYLRDHRPFNKLLGRNANIEFSLGVILQLQKSYEFILDKIKDIDHTINSIVLTGHSLGGAMAQLFTYVYNNSIIPNKIPIKHMITYGQPRILFNKPEYIKMFESSVNSYHRVWNTLDPVPYLPFKKEVVLDSMMDNNIFSGYTHVGNSFNISGNIINNDINLILYEIIKGNKDKIEMLLENKDLLNHSKLLKFMLSEKYLDLLLYGFYKCLESVEVKEEITEEQLNFITMELQKDTSKLLSYAEKCELVKPFGLKELMLMNPIGDDLDEENFSIECIAGCSIASNKMTSEAHKLSYYHDHIDKLIARQIDEKKPLFEVIDKEHFYNPNYNLFKNVEGLFIGEFQNGDFIEIK